MKYLARDGKVCGIYKITNIVTGRLYVGKSKNLRPRYRQYVRGYEKQDTVHMNRYLLRSMNKHGIHNFQMEVIEECDEAMLSERELFWMVELDTLNSGFNLRSDTDQGMVTHDDTRRKITARLKDEWANGVRSEHSSKMKANWETRDRESQASVMTKVLTKWMYRVDSSELLSYAEISEMGFKNVIAAFHKKKSDSVTFKGFKVERFKI